MENTNLQNAEGASQPVAPTPPQQSVPQPIPPQKIGLIFWIKMSLQIFGKNWQKFLILTFVTVLPLIIIFGLLFFLDKPANAAPKVPEKPATEITNTITGIPQDTAVTVNDVSAGNGAPNGDGGGNANPTPPTAPVPPASPTAPVSDLNTSDAAKIIYDSIKNTGTQEVNPADTEKIMGGILGVAFAGSYIIMQLLLLPFFLYQLFIIAAHVRLTILVAQEQDIKLMEVLKWSLKKFGSYILLSIRILIYTYAWLPVVISIVMPLLIFQMGLAALTVLPLLSAAAGIISLVRTPRTLFSYYILAEEGHDSKEALKESIRISTGKWWRIVSFWIGIGIIPTLFLYLSVYGINFINKYVMLTVSGVIVLLGLYILLISFYGFYNLLKSEGAKA